MKILETPRLVLREMTPDDAEAAFLLNSDPEVLRYTGDEPFESIQEARDFLEKYPSYKTYGFGRWAVILKDTGDYVGWCGLKYTPELDEYDIGYRLMKKHWGSGFASEAAEACVKLGFQQFNMQTIVGRVMPENTASVRVLEKIGLTYKENRFTDGTEEIIYVIHKHAL